MNNKRIRFSARSNRAYRPHPTVLHRYRLSMPGPKSIARAAMTAVLSLALAAATVATGAVLFCAAAAAVPAALLAHIALRLYPRQEDYV